MVVRVAYFIWLALYISQLPIKITVTSQIDQTVSLFLLYFGKSSIDPTVNGLSYSRFKFKIFIFLDLFLQAGSSSDWEPLAASAVTLTQAIALKN